MILPYLGQAIRNLFTKPATEKFPLAEAPAAQPHYRGRIAYDPSVCVNCGMCQKVCAPQAISRDIRPLPNGDQEITLTFDLTSCTFCGTCADFCAKHAIQLTDDYMIVGTKPEDFLVSGTFTKKKPPAPKFTPEQIAAMKAAAEAKKKAAAEKVVEPKAENSGQTAAGETAATAAGKRPEKV